MNTDRPTGMQEGEARPWKPPRELVLASAGSGKTYRLSTRIIELLARDVPGDEILASTFTRKAAGEIQDRVLIRLAEAATDPEAAEELAAATGHCPSGHVRDTGPWIDLLGSLLPQLHRLRVGTLDAFLVRLALCFGHELGLPPGWGVADEASQEQFRSDTLDDILAASDRGIMVELLRAAHRGEVIRNVHARLSAQVDALQEILRQGVDGGRAIWAPPLEIPEIEAHRASQLAQGLADRLVALGPPPDATGVNPNPRWEPPIAALADALRAGDWKAFVKSPLISRTLKDGFPYFRSRPTEEMADVLRHAIDLARSQVGSALKRQAASLGRLARLHDEAHEARVRSTGLLRFGDVTHRVRSLDGKASVASVFYRLDTRLKHLLLDEFQDTSLSQWEALRPLARRTLQDPDQARSTVIVADPKQSIYGWRNARPQLAGGVGEEFEMERKDLDRSFRSGKVLVQTVGRIIQGLPHNPVAEELNQDGAALQTWMDAVTPLEAARDRPGHVVLRVGPSDGGQGNIRPSMLDFAARNVERLHTELPGAEIGMLVRTNPAVGYLVGLLRRMGIPTSGEGGTPLTDTGPVNAILSLLRLADHPGDRIARYHVARSPLGAILGYQDHELDRDARTLSLRIREDLLRNGYGRSLAGWAASLGPDLAARERRRMAQLVEEGHLWDGRASIRPGDFVLHVERTRREEGAAAPVRVMTVHQSKGLEFDVVVLPDLGQTMVNDRARDPIKVRDSKGNVEYVYPAMDASTRALFPEVEAAFQGDREDRVLDALSVLYGAMTRARYALHLLVPADGKNRSKALSAANLLRAELAPDMDAVDGETLFEAGDADWWDRADSALRERMRTRRPGDAGDETRAPIRLRTARGRRRNLPRATPSGLEGGSTLDLERFLSVGPSPGMEFGTLVHAWCEEIEWLEDQPPGEDQLLAVAQRISPQLDTGQVAAAAKAFPDWLAPPAIREVFRGPLSNKTARERTVERELPFLVPLEGEILRGTIDRLVLTWVENQVVEAWVVDFKTDRIDTEAGATLEALAAFYRPQLEAYGRAVECLYGLPPQAVRLSLAFLSSGDRIDL